MIDIVEVGSGGGSIVWLDEQKRLHVGPQSAGSTPGPVCYGRGGAEPTVTDANLVLGRLNPDHFLGGELALDVGSPSARSPNASRRRSAIPASAAAIEMADGIARDRDRHHGRRDPPRLGRARPRSARLRALLLWRRRAAACVGAGARAVDPAAWSSRPSRGISRRSACCSPMRGSISPRPSPACSTTRSLPRWSRNFEAMEREAAEALTREFGASEVFLRALCRDALSRPAPQHQGADHRPRRAPPRSARPSTRDYKRRYGHADAKAPAELQALHRLGLRAAAAAGYRASAAPRRQGPRREHAAGLFRQGRRPGRDARL